MSSVNKCIIVGNLGADPEVRSFQNGGQIANMRIATSEAWKDRNTGERKERTEWHSVSVLSEGLIGVCQRFLRKGSKVYIEGQLRTRKWQDQQGQDRYSTEIVLTGYDAKLVMLDGAQGGDQERRGNGGNSSRGQYDDLRGGFGDSGYGGGFQDDLNDDVPFCTRDGIW